jgi:hypothetical protein
MISIYSSDIIPNWNDMRSYFGYNMLGDILLGGANKDLNKSLSISFKYKEVLK